MSKEQKKDDLLKSLKKAKKETQVLKETEKGNKKKVFDGSSR